MASDKTTASPLTAEQWHAAERWRDAHSAHVRKLMASTDAAYPPSGTDRHHPELWKAAHWRWLAQEENNG